MNSLQIGSRFIEKLKLSYKNRCQQWILLNKIHTYNISKGLKFISDEKILQFDKNVSGPNISEKPLTLLYSWLLAKDKHVKKFTEFYIDRGYNVLHIKITPFDLLRPTKGSQVVASEVFEFLLSNQSLSPILIHGFSVGAYLFCESIVKARANREKYNPVLKRMVGQIWDSAVDVYGIPEGFSKAVTSNKALQISFEKYLRWYMKFNYQIATRHYEEASKMMHENAVSVPALFIFSKSDPVSYPEMNDIVVRKYKDMRYPVFSKCFEKSGHVSHFAKYRREYEEEISIFLQQIGLEHKRVDEKISLP